MAGKTDTYENGVLDILRGNPLTPPAARYLSVFTTMPADNGSGGVEPSGGAYARQVINYNAPSGGQMSSSIEALFPEATTDWGKIVGAGVWDALTSGNLWCFDWLGVGQVWKPFVAEATGDTFTSPAHGFSNGHEVVLSAEIAGSLPTGASAATLYYVVNAAADTFKLSTSPGGGAIDLTTAGSGLVRRVIPVTINTGNQIRFKAGTVVQTEN